MAVVGMGVVVVIRVAQAFRAAVGDGRWWRSRDLGRRLFMLVCSGSSLMARTIESTNADD